MSPQSERKSSNRPAIDARGAHGRMVVKKGPAWSVTYLQAEFANADDGSDRTYFIRKTSRRDA
jgi:hypothetical protein